MKKVQFKILDNFFVSRRELNNPTYGDGVNISMGVSNARVCTATHGNCTLLLLPS